MRRTSIFILLPLLSLACSFQLYETPSSRAEAMMEKPSITATTSVIVAVMEVGAVCNVDAEFGLNLRSGAGTEFTVLLVLKNDAEVKVVERKVVEDGGIWLKVVVEGSGMTGWVNGRYICRR